jgi:esterase/lipase
MKQRIFFIPGLGENAKLRYSKEFINQNKDHYTIVPILLPYNEGYIVGKNNSLVDLVNDAKKQISQYKIRKEDIIVGFSMGALIAYMISTKIKFQKVLICSITAILGEDTHFFTEVEKKYFSNKQLKELAKLKYKKPISPVIYFSASKESKEMTQRPKKLHEKYGGLYISVGRWPHSFSGKYIEVVKRFL